ncbi:MAG TPA: CaiB/BaiF CoA-transferase family protein [Mycobacteriales bacterium]|nr:CaiB/BaiF CoA-transferase family protein [Mycobacteriales bacterium]
MSHGPLGGITVLDLSSVGPAARASRWLSDYGAAVVKVGPVPTVRGPGVQIVPPFHAYSGQRGIRRTLIDLKASEGRAVFLRLTARADVIIESFRPGVADRLGIGYDDVKGRNPRIVYCSTSGYGQHGPRSQWAGHDLNYLAVAGFLHTSGRGPDGRPVLPGATVADSAGGGLHAVTAILASLVARAQTGEGCYLDVSIADGVLALMALQVDEYLAVGRSPEPGSGLLTGRYACYDTYRTSDGGWLAVAAIEPRFWANLCRTLGLEKWINHQTDDAVQDDVRRDLAAVLAGRSRLDWETDLAGADTCIAAVRPVEEVVVDEHFSARGAVIEAQHPSHGALRQLGPLLAGAPRAEQPVVLPDPATTDTDELLSAAGYTASDCRELRAKGVVG